MGRPLRFVPPGALVEVTTRTVQGRFLLRPSAELNDRVLGILGRAARRYPVRVCAFVFLSNHAHLLLRPANAHALAGFMAYLNGNLAREAGRLHRWHDKFWSRRYRAVVVSHEPEAQLQRLRYLLAQGCKEGLVASPTLWPGATAVHALLHGTPLTGHWIDRTAAYAARHRGENPSPADYTETVHLELAPLPAWDALPLTERQQRVATLVHALETETRAAPTPPRGRRHVLRQHPHHRPRHPHRSPAPRFHAFRPDVRHTLERAYAHFHAAFRQAVHNLRAGLPPHFPDGAFLPPLPCLTTPP